MSKKYDTTNLENELSGGASLFFSDAARKKEAQKLGETPQTQEPERSNTRTVERSNGKRIITRNSFEIFEDQMDALREKAYLEKREGRLGSMSAMVRAAIDSYLNDK